MHRADGLIIRKAVRVATRLLCVGLVIGLLGTVSWFAYHALRSNVSLTDAQWPPLVLAIVLHFLVLFLLLFSWERLLALFWVSPGDQTDKPTRVSLYRAYSRSWLARYIPGRVWALGGRLLLVNRLGVPTEAVARSMALEFIFSYGMLAILGAALVVSTVVQPLVGAGTVVIGVVVAAVGIPVAQKMLACGNTQVYRNHSWYRVQHFIHRLFVGERPLSWWDTIRATGLYGISSCLQLTFIVFLAESFVNLTLGQAVAVAGAWALSTCFGYFVFLAPAGIGVRDGLALALFSQVLDVPTAGLVVAASRVVMVATDLCFVAIIEALATSLRIKRKVFGPAIGIEAS